MMHNHPSFDNPYYRYTPSELGLNIKCQTPHYRHINLNRQVGPLHRKYKHTSELLPTKRGNVVTQSKMADVNFEWIEHLSNKLKRI